jgi:sporulation protein YhbH
MTSIFREHKTNADRSAGDRQRHKAKIEKAIRDGITDIVANESIIGQNGKKKIRIPVKGIREWQFVYGDNPGDKNVGSAPGSDLQKGQVIQKGQNKQVGSPGAGNNPGEEFYEVEISLDELSNYLFDSLNLPDLEKKQFKEMTTEKVKRHGHRTEGILPRLDKKASAINRIKRLNAAKREGNIEIDDEGNPIFPFHNNDLKFHHIKQVHKENSNAVIFFMMDTSGSMTKEIKFVARSFYFLLYQFLRHRYQKIEIVFISHSMEAFEVDEKSFFTRGSSGGTYVSSAPSLALDIIYDRFHPSSWNIYAFHCTDGDNWESDNEKTFEMYRRLSDISQMVGYCEIELNNERIAWIKDENRLTTILKNVSSNLKVETIKGKEDIWRVFKRFFGDQNG